jgi:hypothetical protein
VEFGGQFENASPSFISWELKLSLSLLLSILVGNAHNRSALAETQVD